MTAQTVTIEYETDQDGNELVYERWACPKCSERRMDYLEAQDDGETVICATCGMIYALEYADAHN